MKLNTQCINFSPKEKLIKLIDKKIEKLDTFYSKVVGYDLYMKVDNGSVKENKIIELKAKIPGNEFVVKKNNESFEKAISSVFDAMTRILKRENEREAKRL